MSRPRKDQQIDIPRRAVEAAIRLLDRRDAASLTLAEVADMVGCRAPALYTHFANKDSLLRAVHDEGFRMMLEGKFATAGNTAADPFDRLRDGGLAYLRFAFDNPGLYRLMFSFPGAGIPAKPFNSDPGRQCLAILRSAVDACRGERNLHADTGQLAFFLWSTVHGAAMLVLQDRAPIEEGVTPMAAAIRTVDTAMKLIRSACSEFPE